MSQGGAAIAAETTPVAGQEVWRCPHASSSVGWIEGTVVRVSSPGRLRVLLGRPTEIGIRFREYCAWVGLRAALFGVGESNGPDNGLALLPGSGGFGS